MQFEKFKDARKIGEGAHKEVFRAPGEKFVRAEFKYPYTPEQAKSIFYLTNIIHSLFPRVVVRVTQVGNSKEGKTIARTEYVSPEYDTLHQSVQEEAMVFSTQSERYSEKLDEAVSRMNKDENVQGFLNQFEQAGLYAHSAYLHGWGGQDLIYDKEKNFRFVDVNPAWYEPEELGKSGYTVECLTFDPQRLLLAINALPQGGRKKEALVFYQRLIALCKEVGFSFMNEAAKTKNDPS